MLEIRVQKHTGEEPLLVCSSTIQFLSRELHEQLLLPEQLVTRAMGSPGKLDMPLQTLMHRGPASGQMQRKPK